MAMIVRPAPRVRDRVSGRPAGTQPPRHRAFRPRPRDGNLTAGGQEGPPVPDSLSLIVNPVAGRGRALAILAQATAELDALGVSYQVTRSASLEQAGELAVTAATIGNVVVAVGGDGMAGALAGVAAAAGATLGIIPAGRGNDLAMALGIPAAPREAARLLVQGQPRRADLIGVAVPGRPERMVAGSVYAGLPAVAGELANASRWLAGPAVYPAAALRALAAWRPVRFCLAPAAAGGPAGDGSAGSAPVAGEPVLAAREFAGYAVVIANIPRFGAGMRVAPPARMDDGLLDVVTMRDGPRLAFLRVLVSIRSGAHVSLAQVGLDRAAALTLTMDRALPVGADGEPLPGASPLPAGTPLTIRARPAALTVLAPAGPLL
jgi:diacylglycerol kinase (ATP)